MFVVLEMAEQMFFFSLSSFFLFFSLISDSPFYRMATAKRRSLSNADRCACAYHNVDATESGDLSLLAHSPDSMNSENSLHSLSLSLMTVELNHAHCT